MKKLQVIPAINCLDLECVFAKINEAEKFLKSGDWLHLDAGDGIFTFSKTWRNPTEWANMRSEFNLEVHLMAENPKKYIEGWIAAGAKRLIVHAETLSEETAREITKFAARRGVETMLSSSPYATISEIWPFLKFFSNFQVLAVDPGPAGQKFLPAVLEKIKFLRNFAPYALIEVDGGINPETAKRAKDAGANIVVSASYIFDNKNPKKAFKKLQKS